MTLIYKRTGNPRAVQMPLGHINLESTVRYLGVDAEDALVLSEATDVLNWRAMAGRTQIARFVLWTSKRTPHVMSASPDEASIPCSGVNAGVWWFPACPLWERHTLSWDIRLKRWLGGTQVEKREYAQTML